MARLLQGAQSQARSESMMDEEKFESEKQQIRNRLENVCAHLSRESFEELVARIAQTHERDAHRSSPFAMHTVKPKEPHRPSGPV